MSNPTIGERLRSARESIPASIYQVSRETKIRSDFIELMERDNFRFMSGTPYVKGLLRSYVRYLGVAEGEVLNDFERLYGSPRGPSIKQIFKEPASAPKSRSPRWLVAAVVAAGTLMVFSLVGIMQPSTPDVAAPPKPNEVSAGTPSPQTSAPQVAALPEFQGVELQITITGERCWLRVEGDGNSVTPVFEGTLFAGDSRTFKANDQLKVTFGNIGAVKVMVNGRELSVEGTSGQVGSFIFYPDKMTSLTRG